jgi:hypothetical protein
LKHPKPGGL